MYLLEINLQSTALGIVMIVGVGIIVILILMKNPKENQTGLFEGRGGVKVVSKEETASFMDYINQGNTALSLFDYDKALENYQAALKIKSSDPSVHFKIGRVFTQKEDYKNAISAFRNVLNLNPDMLEAHFELARLFQVQKNFDMAHQELDHALHLKPEHEDSLKMKIKLLEQTQDYRQALPYMRQLIEVANSPTRYQAMLADYLTRLGEYEAAISEYTSLIETDFGNRLEYQGKVGQAYFDQGEYGLSIDYFKMVLQEQNFIQDQEYLLHIKSQLAAAICNEGVKHFQAGDSTTAISHYQEALLYDNTNPDIHYNLGKALARTHDVPKALQHFETAMTLNPHDVGSCYEMALLQDEKGMMAEAQTNYERVLSIDSRHFDAVFGLGTLHGLQGNIDQAIHYLTLAISINPEDVDAIYNLGVALERKKDFNKAIKMYKKVLSLDTLHEKARSNLAHIQQVKNQ